MSNFPPEIDLIVIDDLYTHYDLGFDDDTGLLYVYCCRCDEIVCTLEYDDIDDMGEIDLYDEIVNSHQKI